MKLLLSLLSILCSTLIFSQAQITINNDAYITLSGGTAATPIYIVVDNPNDNAINTAGTGGNLISENEYNKVRWNIGNNTGNYVLPYTTGTGTDVKMPLTYQITGAGSGGTHIDFSTYSTTIANTPYPSMVNNVLDQNTETTDNSDYILDRFWIIDAMNYTTRPSVTMQMGYDPDETVGNIVAPGAMFAQRYNSTTDSWTSGGPGLILTFGADNAGAQTVENIVVSSAEMYEAWSIFDNTNPLPVELTYFSAECMSDYVDLNWQTASETHASHFNIQKSIDGNTWQVISTAQAQGTTSATTNYNYRDYNPNGTVAYYRLVQFDFDGEYKIYDAQSVDPCNGNDLSIEISNMPDNNFQVKITSPTKQSFQLDMMAINGQLVRETKTLNTVEGDNIYLFDGDDLSTGIYMISVYNETEKKTQKLIIN